MKPDLTVHTCNLGTQEAEAESLPSLGSPVATKRLTGQPGLHGLCLYVIYINILYIYMFLSSQTQNYGFSLFPDNLLIYHFMWIFVP